MLPAQDTANGLTPDDFLIVSTPVTPHVAYAVTQNPGGLRLVIEAASLQSDLAGVSVSVGVAAGKTITLDPKSARVSRHDGLVDFDFDIPAAQLVDQPADWKKLRLGFAVSWAGGPFGQDRLKRALPSRLGGAERRPVRRTRLIGLRSTWMQHAAEVTANLKNRLFVDLNQPMDGKATDHYRE